MTHEKASRGSDEWFTPKYIFDALGTKFDVDVAGDLTNPFQCVPADSALDNGLLEDWRGFVWMNPPFGGRNALYPWVSKFVNHAGGGIALVPDRTSADWWQRLAKKSDAICFVSPKIKFVSGAGIVGESPGNGTTLHGIGEKAVLVLNRCGLGFVSCKKGRP